MPCPVLFWEAQKRLQVWLQPWCRIRLLFNVLFSGLQMSVVVAALSRVVVTIAETNVNRKITFKGDIVAGDYELFTGDYESMFGK